MCVLECVNGLNSDIKQELKTCFKNVLIAIRLHLQLGSTVSKVGHRLSWEVGTWKFPQIFRDFRTS